VVGVTPQEKSPLITQVKLSVIKYAGLEYISSLARATAEFTVLAVAVHLFHGNPF
jgi:fructose-bisphosphate aldolase class II